MAPLESLGRTKSAPVSSGFDDFDDLLNAPTRTSKKSSKSKKGSKKKSSSKKKFNIDDSDDFGSPASKASSGPLSPFGDSFEHDVFGGIEPPRGTGAADLDDSILGGLLSGPSKAPPRGMTRAKTSGSILGDSKAPELPGPSFSTKDKYSSSSPEKKFTAAPVEDDDFFPPPSSRRAATASESTMPSSTRSTASTEGGRPGMSSFSSVPNIDRDGTDTGPSSARSTRPGMTKHSSITSFAPDTDELSMDFDIDSLLPEGTNAVGRPPTNAGRKNAHVAKDPWSDDNDGDKLGSSLDKKDSSVSLGRPQPDQRGTTAPVTTSSRGLGARGPATTTAASAAAASSHWNDDIGDDDFDVDALLPDNEPSMRPGKSTSTSSAASVRFSPDTNKRPTTTVNSRDIGNESPQTLPSAAPLSRGRSAPASTASARGRTDSSLESPDRLTEPLPDMQQPHSRSSSPLVVSGRPSTGSPTHAEAPPAETVKRQQSTEDDVDIGFMPSFLDPSREPPRGRR
jgi:hypothetical protein